MKRDFDPWLEFEQWVAKDTDDPEADTFIMTVTLPTGEKYALNVWTFKILDVIRQEREETGEYLGGKYLPAPDLFVTSLDRPHVEEVIADLIANGGLKEEWLVPDHDE